MSNISMVEAKLPPGFRFHPRDDELVCDYLMKKGSHGCEALLLIEVDLNKCEPWNIPETACVGGKEWYFYSLRDRKYATGIRTNRATASGYWKATGKDRAILRKGSLVGMRKTLVFYQGRAPKGRKTDWVMHEFRMEGSSFASSNVSSFKGDWVLCRVFYKNREAISTQQRMESCIDDNVGCSSLPPLMDYITFDHQPQPIHFYDQFDDDDDHEQVPCFSIFSSQQQEVVNDLIPTNTTNPNIFSHMQQLPNIDISTTTKSTFPVVGSACLDMVDPFSCDTYDVKSVLNQLTKIESNNVNHIVKGSSPSIGEPSSERDLSEVGILTNMWNHF